MSRRTSETAYERIREEIITWELPPNTLMVEAELSERFNVSRTPVREALARLASESLVSYAFGRTAIVAPMEEADIRALFETRCALETRAARLACGKRDVEVFEELRERMTDQSSASDPGRVYALARELDQAIDAAMDNSYLLSSLNGIRGHLRRARQSALFTKDQLEEANTEHLLIVDAILAGDAPLAENATVVHLHHGLRNILRSLRSAPRSGTELSSEKTPNNARTLVAV